MSRIVSLAVVCITVMVMTTGAALAATLDPAKSIGQYVYESWGTRDGLPVSAVVSATRTPDGYLWIGTETGLLRFDGIRFTLIDRRRFPDPMADISPLLTDASGLVWIGTDRGIMVWNGTSGRGYTTADGLAGDTVLCLYEDRDRAIWIGTRTGVSRFKDGRFTSYTTRDGLPHNAVQAMAQSRDGTMWLATNGGVAHLVNGRFTTLTTKQGLASDLVQAVYEDRRGVLWVGTFGGLHRIEKNEIRVYTTREGLSHNLVNQIVEDDAGSLWLSTYGGGLTRYRDGRFERFTAADGLASNFLYNVFLDQDGSLWMLTQGGLARLRDGVIAPYTKREGLGSDIVRAVMEDRHGAMWFGTHGGGLTRLEHGRFTTFTTKDGLASDVVFALTEDARGRLWAGSYNGGISRMEHGRFQRIESDQLAREHFVTCFLEDRTGTMWAGTYGGGLKRFAGDTVTTFTTRDGLGSDYVWAMTLDADGVLWIGTKSGLTKYADGRFTTYTTKDGLPDAEIFALMTDVDGSVWVASDHGGLSRLKNGRIARIDAAPQMFIDTVFGILGDDRGYLWCSTNHGLHRVARQDLHDLADGRRVTARVVRYDRADGMKTEECNGSTQPSGWRARDGRLWFATQGGVITLDPSRVADAAAPSSLRAIVEQVIVDGQPLASASDSVAVTTMGSTVAAAVLPTVLPTVPAGSQRLEFHFTGPYLSAPQRVRFRYRLDGYDSNWVEAGARRVAYYTDVPPGTHRFRVAAAIDGGPWTTNEGVLALRIAPRFYQTWWFFAACSAGAAALLWSAHRYRVQQLVAVERVRTRIASDLHDDIGSSLSQIAILSEVVRARVEPAPVEITDPLARIGSLSRESVDAMGDIVWAINPQQGTPTHLSQRMRRLASDLLPPRGIQLTFEATDEEHAWLGMETRREVFLIFKEALHNVLRHAGATDVSIALTIGRRALRLAIADNGAGFDVGAQAASMGPGQGLRSMTRRAEAIGGRVAFTSAPGQGTSIVVDVPVR